MGVECGQAVAIQSLQHHFVYKQERVLFGRLGGRGGVCKGVEQGVELLVRVSLSFLLPLIFFLYPVLSPPAPLSSSPLIAKDAAFPPYWCENSAVTGKQPLDSFSRSHRAEPRTTEAPTSATTITAQDTRRRERRAAAAATALAQTCQEVCPSRDFVHRSSM